jgi:putative transposase
MPVRELYPLILADLADSTSVSCHRSVNAPTESFFNSLKNERVHATRYRTHHDAKADLFEYIEVFYNRCRRHSSLGFVSPERFLRNWIRAQQTKDASA